MWFRAKVSPFSFHPTLLVAFRRGAELRLETPMRSESHESHGLPSLVPSQNLLHRTLLLRLSYLKTANTPPK